MNRGQLGRRRIRDSAHHRHINRIDSDFPQLLQVNFVTTLNWATLRYLPRHFQLLIHSSPHHLTLQKLLPKLKNWGNNIEVQDC